MRTIMELVFKTQEVFEGSEVNGNIQGIFCRFFSSSVYIYKKERLAKGHILIFFRNKLKQL